MGNCMFCKKTSGAHDGRSNSCKVWLADGNVMLIFKPTKVKVVMQRYQNYFLVNSKSLQSKGVFTALNADTILLMNSVYVMFPMERIHTEITSADIEGQLGGDSDFLGGDAGGHNNVGGGRNGGHNNVGGGGAIFYNAAAGAVRGALNRVYNAAGAVRDNLNNNNGRRRLPRDTLELIPDRPGYAYVIPDHLKYVENIPHHYARLIVPVDSNGKRLH